MQHWAWLLVSCGSRFPLKAHAGPSPQQLPRGRGLQCPQPPGRRNFFPRKPCSQTRWADLALHSPAGGFLTTEVLRVLGPGFPLHPMPVDRLGPHGFSSAPRGPMSCRTTASPSLSRWPQACSTWRKPPRYGGLDFTFPSLPAHPRPWWPSPRPRGHPGTQDLGAGLPSSHNGLCPLPQFLAFTCGLLCGALHTLGFQSLVTASVAALPACESGGFSWSFGGCWGGQSRPKPHPTDVGFGA